MKIHELREMKTDEIRKQLEEEKKNLVDLRFSHQLKQLTNTAKLKFIKKDIARMNTVLKERESEVVKVDENKKGVKS
jgi:large subunit ribosomal protein L29